VSPFGFGGPAEAGLGGVYGFGGRSFFVSVAAGFGSAAPGFPRVPILSFGLYFFSTPSLWYFQNYKYEHDCLIGGRKEKVPVYLHPCRRHGLGFSCLLDVRRDYSQVSPKVLSWVHTNSTCHIRFHQSRSILRCSRNYASALLPL
jgi:hypothetical protein